jgi:lactate dehydrogenase-like 2-hydroxyacid dehydrogenase
MELRKVFVASSGVGNRIRELEKWGIEVITWSQDSLPTPDQILTELRCNGAAVLINIGTDNLEVRGAFLEQIVDLGIKVIATRSTGLNLVDLGKCSELSILVVYSP